MSSSGGGSNRVFGQAMKRRGGNSSSSTRYQRQMGSSSTRYNNPNDGDEAQLTEEELLAQRRAEAKRRRRLEGEDFDKGFGYGRFEYKTAIASKKKKKAKGEGGGGGGGVETRRGWLFNMLPTTITMADDGADDDPSAANGTGGGGGERSGVDLYFLSDDGSTFKSTVLHEPYFFLVPSTPSSNPAAFGNAALEEDDSIYIETLKSTLLRKYESHGLSRVEAVKKEDLDQVNHLGVGKDGRVMLKLVFDNVQQLMDVRKSAMELVKRNQEREKEDDSNMVTFQHHSLPQAAPASRDPLSTLIDIREYDVPYLVRVCTDLKIRAGSWFTVTPNPTDIGVTLSDPDITKKANPSFLAFDIECTKAPLKFPDANVDSIFMISYMVNGQGYLIISRHVVGQDIDDFEYTPKPTYPGPFHIFNEGTEEDLIRRFFDEYKKIKPQIVVTYNGDFFDWPFLEQRAALYGLDIRKELGVEQVGDEEYRGRCSVHLDAFSWVKRDSYLPQGAQGLKAVTKYKLGYDPVEVDPEDMVRFAQERPVHMASYSVSDAVATYYLYEKYVHMFIFSLCTIIPMGPEDVLRKGSGTLCETLLMVEACTKDIICPNKEVDPLAKFHDGHLLESETYIGGKVECLETGVYRSDVEYKFDLKPSAFQGLIDNIDRDLTFAIEVEGGMDRSKVVNYDDIRCQIIEQLEMLRDRPTRTEKPYVYHLDVGAMYPNIILTNRLQPSAIVDDATCAACDFNQSKNDCKRKMDWVWRGDYNPATKSEYDRTKDQLSRETFEDGKAFHELSDKEQAELIAGRLKIYSKNAYKKTKVTEEVTRKDTVCMRENDFYVDTVRQFRDRRYEYKKATKVWKKKVGSAKDPMSKKEAEDKSIVFDSLQVAHKCILNSFYGYVMRKGARWRSMEMAGIVTKTGADLITQARILVEQIGRPLELDTDGIWCILPQSFPDVFYFKTVDGSKLKLEYPCIMLNADVHDNFTNHQYQTLKDKNKRTYETRSECSIFFEVDGPYRCMVLPASTEEGRLLKKRYAVFNFDGSLAELKGFELKRRGELELIKTFQSQVFERFLDGETLIDCYDSVAEIANHWIDILDTQGESLDTDELVDLISENRNMSRQLEDYGDQKGTSQTTARRLGDFLGAEIIKDKGLNCKFIIAEQPHGAPVTERAIPTAIWKAEPAVMKHFLRKWLKSPGLDGDDFDIRNILDWDYYMERLSKTIQKIITIPAALQKVPNPVPRVPHPDWLQRTVRRLNDPYKQKSIKSMFGVIEKKKKTSMIENGNSENNSSSLNSPSSVQDIEDFGGGGKGPGRPIVHTSRRRQRVSLAIEDGTEPPSAAEITMESASKTNEAVIEKVSLSKDTFQTWLARKKKIWRNSRKERQKRSRGINASSSRIGTGDATAEPSSKKQRRTVGSMEGYIRDAAIALTQHEWHIIEVGESSSAETNGSSSHSNFILWVMMGNNSLQKIHLRVPRTLYLNCRSELQVRSGSNITAKRVEKHLPHNKAGGYLFEVVLSDDLFRMDDWVKDLVPEETAPEQVIESVYEMSTPLVLRSLVDLGCVSRLSDAAARENTKTAKSFALSDLSRVVKPDEGEYLHSDLSYRRIFFYESLHSKNKTGLIALFIMDGGSGGRVEAPGHDLTRPNSSSRGTFLMNATCHIWIVKPGGTKGQKNVSVKQCEGMFGQLLAQLQGSSPDTEDPEEEASEYACLSSDSQCSVLNLAFADSDRKALAGANDVLNKYLQSNHGPTFLLLNSSKPQQQLRKVVPSCNSFPLVTMPFPPGPAHNSSLSVLPALNWEPMAVQLCLEAYLYMGVVSYPKRVSCARFGHIPIGNLGRDENVTLYDVSFARHLHRSRTLLWASEISGRPDLGCNSLSLTKGCSGKGVGPINDDLLDNSASSNNDMWGDDDELISPVIRRPGAYRCICVEIDVYDLAIAALTDSSLASMAGAQLPMHQDGENGLFSAGSEGAGTMMSSSAPLGDDMSTAISLPLLRSLVQTWLRDAYQFNSHVADDLLHHIYRLVCSQEAMLNDPALHRVVHSLMKTMFLRLLGELQRLGSTIVSANFHRVVVATNKIDLYDAKEYIEFVIATIQKRGGGGPNRNHLAEGLGRIALRPNNYYTHYLFLDESNFGGIHYEQREVEDDEEAEWASQLSSGREDQGSLPIVPTVVSGWNIMQYLASEISQEYFRAIIGRFSKDVFRKWMLIQSKTSNAEDGQEGGMETPDALSTGEELLVYQKKLVSRHFATYLTRAVGEIMKDGGGPESFPRLPGSHLSLTNPALEFVKSVLTVLELDRDVEREVQILKKSLLAQVGVQEYSDVTKWENPCASFVLPNVFCLECHESRDVNLCVLPPPDEENNQTIQWQCEDCGSAFDTDQIERRLVDMVQRKSTRYQLQDLRCSRTEKVATRCLARQSDCSAELKLDIPQRDFMSEMIILRNLAKFHGLDWLLETTAGLLTNFASSY